MSRALDGAYGLGIMWCDVAEAFLSLLFHMSHEVSSSARHDAAPPQGPAARAMPNDPRHITTHDASLPRGEG